MVATSSGSRPAAERTRAIRPTIPRSCSKGSRDRRARAFPTGPPGGGAGRYVCPPGTRHEGEPDGSVFVVNADGTGLHRIASQVADAYSLPRWSPDGRWILFSAFTNHEGAAVYVVRPDGSGLRRITLEFPRLRQAYYRSWSPDGTRFVFVGASAHGYNLFTARKDGTDVEQITHTRGIAYRSLDW
jgi:WD40 repeat protein